MSFFLRPAGPRALWRDLTNFWRNRPRGQWIAGVLALLITSGILLAFFIDSQNMADRRERITFIDSWPATRTDDEIRAKQKTDLTRREAAAARQREQFRRVDENLNRLGL